MPYVRKFKRNPVYKKVVHPYVNKKKGYANRQKLYKEITAIKKMINAEKKNADTTSTSITNFAQNNGAGSGQAVFSVMPIIAQGSSEDQRNGDSLKICSLCFQCEVFTNSFNTIQDTRYKIYLIRQPTNPVSGSNVANQFLEPNPFSGVNDYNSNRDYEHFKDYIVIGMIRGVLKQNTNDSANQIRKNQHKLARKLQYHVRYEKGTTIILNNTLYIVAVADSGDTATNNYIRMQYSTKVYYYDN